MSGTVPPPVTGGGRGGEVPLPTGDNPPVVLINNMDVGNPLHVHNSDNNSSILVPFKLLGTENYRMWNNAMKLALQARNTYCFVDGTCLRDSFADSEVLCTQWDRCNVMVLTWIMNVVSSDVYMGLVYSENDASTWKDLNETYDKVDGSMVYNFLQKIGSVKQGGSTVAVYYHRTALLTRDPFHDVKDAYAIVSREESHMGIPETSEAINTKMNATSFAAKSYNQNKRDNTNSFNRNNTRGNGPNNYNREPNPNLVCNNCGFTGHTIERCYELIRYPPRYKTGFNASKQNGIKPNFNANCDTKGGDKQPTACNSPTSFTADQM
ncbi:ribonuclease H-like domain-containing protein [Tanacetum coccineum]